VEISERFFPEPWQIAVVIEPAQMGPCIAGVFALEGVRYALQFEMDVRPRRRSPAPPPPPPPPPEPEPEILLTEEPDPLPVEPPRPEWPGDETPVPLPSWAEAEPPRRGNWRWIVGSVALLAVATVLVAWSWTSKGTRPRLSLWVADVGAQLLIEWDRTARPIRDATAGIIEIRDGGEKVVVQMDPERLREGSVDYVRRSDIVDVRLRVQDAGGRAAEEQIRFVGPPIARDDDVVRQRDELKAEVERLRAELEKVRGGRIGRNASPRTP
jgi:hypothetical protein